MGHKGSQPFADDHAVEVLDDEQLVDVLETNRQASIQAKMRGHTELAVATIADVAEFGKTDSARRRAARDILEYGHGRPTQQVLHQGGGGGGVTINVLSFASGERREVKAVEEPEKDPAMALLDQGGSTPEIDTAAPAKPFGVKVSSRRAERARKRMEAQP